MHHHKAEGRNKNILQTESSTSDISKTLRRSYFFLVKVLNASLADFYPSEPYFYICEGSEYFFHPSRESTLTSPLFSPNKCPEPAVLEEHRIFNISRERLLENLVLFMELWCAPQGLRRFFHINIKEKM